MNIAATLPPAMDEDTLEQLIDVVRKFVNERLIPQEAQVAEEDIIPTEIIQEMREMGLFGLTIPQQYGGIGLNTYEECRVVMELGRTSPAWSMTCCSTLRQSMWRQLLQSYVMS